MFKILSTRNKSYLEDPYENGNNTCRDDIDSILKQNTPEATTEAITLFKAYETPLALLKIFLLINCKQPELLTASTLQFLTAAIDYCFYYIHSDNAKLKLNTIVKLVEPLRNNIQDKLFKEKHRIIEDLIKQHNLNSTFEILKHLQQITQITLNFRQKLKRRRLNH